MHANKIKQQNKQKRQKREENRVVHVATAFVLVIALKLRREN